MTADPSKVSFWSRSSGCWPHFKRTRCLAVAPPPSTLLASPREAYYNPRPTKVKNDSPLAVIYRIYWAIVMDDTFAMRNELEYFWGQKGASWKVNNIPKPPDFDPERFAIVAAIAHILAAAFNRIIDLGLSRHASKCILTSAEVAKAAQEPKVFEKVPQWAVDAPPLDQPLILPTKDLGAPSGPDEEGVDPFMVQKNVLVWRLHVYFT